MNDNERITALRFKILNIFGSQFNRRQLIRLSKAFAKWAYEFPLFVKTDELWIQLKERNKLADTLRSAYLKDVVSVKAHLNSVIRAAKAADNADKPQDFIDSINKKEDLYELDIIPSLDIRQIITKAQTNYDQISEQFLHSLVDAGIVDEFTMKTLNPWEQSRSYRRILRQKLKPKLHDVKGESVTLFAPKNQKLFIKYCEQCIGVTKLVRDWNVEVEEALKFKTDRRVYEGQIAELKRVVNTLTDEITRQEVDIAHLKSINGEMEVSSAWFEKWSSMKEFEEMKAMVSDTKITSSNLLVMAGLDKESALYELSLKMRSIINNGLNREELLKLNINQLELEKEKEINNKLKLIQELDDANKEIYKRDRKIEKLEKVVDELNEQYAKVEPKMKSLEKLNNELKIAIDLKESQFDFLRNETFLQIENLTAEFDALTEAMKRKELELDELHEQLRDYKSRCELLEDNLSFIKDKLQVYLDDDMKKAMKPKYSLKAVAIVVRTYIRMKRCFKRDDMKPLGMYGLRILLKRAIRERNEFEIMNSLQAKSLEILEMKYDQIMDEKNALSIALREAERDNAALLKLESQLRADLAASELKFAEEKKLYLLEQSSKGLDLETEKKKSLYYQYLITEYRKDFKLTKILLQLQRSSQDHLTHTIFMLRSILYSLNIDSDLAFFNTENSKSFMSLSRSISQNYSPLSSNSRVNTPKSKSKPSKFKNRVRELINWMKSNNQTKCVNPFKTPIDFRRVIDKNRKEKFVEFEKIIIEHPPANKETSKNLEEGHILAVDSLDLLQFEPHLDRSYFLKNLKYCIDIDLQHSSKIRDITIQEVRKVESYIFTLREKYNESLKQIIATPEQIDHSNDSYAPTSAAGSRNRSRMQTTKRNTSTRQSKTNNNALLNLKSSFSHLLLEEGDISTYLTGESNANSPPSGSKPKKGKNLKKMASLLKNQNKFLKSVKSRSGQDDNTSVDANSPNESTAISNSRSHSSSFIIKKESKDDQQQAIRDLSLNNSDIEITKTAVAESVSSIVNRSPNLADKSTNPSSINIVPTFETSNRYNIPPEMQIEVDYMASNNNNNQALGFVQSTHAMASYNQTSLMNAVDLSNNNNNNYNSNNIQLSNNMAATHLPIVYPSPHDLAALLSRTTIVSDTPQNNPMNNTTTEIPHDISSQILSQSYAPCYMLVMLQSDGSISQVTPQNMNMATSFFPINPHTPAVNAIQSDVNDTSLLPHDYAQALPRMMNIPLPGISTNNSSGHSFLSFQITPTAIQHGQYRATEPSSGSNLVNPPGIITTQNSTSHWENPWLHQGLSPRSQSTVLPERHAKEVYPDHLFVASKSIDDHIVTNKPRNNSNNYDDVIHPDPVGVNQPSNIIDGVNNAAVAQAVLNNISSQPVNSNNDVIPDLSESPVASSSSPSMKIASLVSVASLKMIKPLSRQNSRRGGEVLPSQTATNLNDRATPSSEVLAPVPEQFLTEESQHSLQNDHLPSEKIIPSSTGIEQITASVSNNSNTLTGNDHVDNAAANSNNNNINSTHSTVINNPTTTTTDIHLNKPFAQDKDALLAIASTKSVRDESTVFGEDDTNDNNDNNDENSTDGSERIDEFELAKQETAALLNKFVSMQEKITQANMRIEMSKKHYGKESQADLESGTATIKPATNIIYGKIPDFPVLTYGANGLGIFLIDSDKLKSQERRIAQLNKEIDTWKELAEQDARTSDMDYLANEF
eukprot:gene5875-8102_t